MAQLHSETRASGRMTAVMQAVPSAGPKVLRIAAVTGGRIVEERIFKKRVDVSVGANERNTFVVRGAAQGTLFELTRDGYRLNPPRGARGRVMTASGVIDLEKHDGAIALDDAARGKIVFGETTLLFQMVVAPPLLPRPQLPVSVTRGAGAPDWTTMVVAALSFLLHFMALGSLYSDWLDPVVDDGVVVSGLVDAIQVLPPPVVETDPQMASTASPAASRPTAATPPRGAAGGRTPAGSSAGAAAGRQAALAHELEQIELATLGTLGQRGPATAGVLSGHELPTTALDAAAQSEAGVSSGQKLTFHGGGALTPGKRGGTLSELGERGTSVAQNDTGTATTVAPPKGAANVPPPVVGGGDVANASAVVAGMRAGFRRCYNLGLLDHPDAQGTVRLSITVGPGGEVRGVSASPSGNLPSSVVACVRSRASVATFDAPVGGSAVVNVPVSFLKLPGR
ncbi:MAG: AgmX/PglI C-terminal domain-containing protein [Myxococcales bacterium]|nr:AgmX/PglI C-terminal domain-containing protein [Myxococcales bacterium]MCB9579262.1 AgmX/PglI C-terminal domain-containing protein [Polyangiaceae bacterium]